MFARRLPRPEPNSLRLHRFAGGCFCALTALLFTSGCIRLPHRAGNPAANKPGTADRSAATPTPAARPAFGERLGTVHVIGTGQRFVLVQTPALQPVSTLVDGQALVCRAAGSVTGTLRVSHERRPPFVVADVTAGEPHVGDDVFIDTAPGHTAIPAAQSSPPASPSPPTAPDFRAEPPLPPPR